MFKKNLGLAALAVSFLSALVVMGTPTKVQAMPVNDYIISNRIQPATIQNREGTFNDWTPYENGVGKPEGVVVHETADSRASAEDEYSFFNNNWWTYSTYVHALADNKEIINMHSTDYAVWGAGPTANAKFIQIELCRAHTGDEFARSIANDAYYVASKLIQYNLPDTPGVTVLSHHQTSLKWHETTHVDPDTYFPLWGYSMNEMNDMIGYYYKNLKTYGSVYPSANTNSGSNNAAASNNNVIKVNNSKGDFVPLFAMSNTSITMVRNRALANNTAWRTDQTKTIGGVTYRRVATNEWIASNYIV